METLNELISYSTPEQSRRIIQITETMSHVSYDRFKYFANDVIKAYFIYAENPRLRKSLLTSTTTSLAQYFGREIRDELIALCDKNKE